MILAKKTRECAGDEGGMGPGGGLGVISEIGIQEKEVKTFLPSTSYKI